MAIRGNSLAAENYQEPDWEAAVAKEATDVQERFAQWLVDKASDEIKEQLKVDLENGKQLKAFEMGVILGTRFRMKFQASPENQEASAAPEEKAPVKPAKAAAKGKKSKAIAEEEDEAPVTTKSKKASKAKPAPVEAEDEDDEDEAPKAKKAGKSSAKKGGRKAAF